MQASSGSEELRLQESRARSLLEETTQQRSEFTFHSSSFWARKGDRMSCEFFCTHGQRSAGEQVHSLRSQDGSLRTAPEEVMEIATDYYKTLFQKEQLAPRARRCREEVWRHTPRLVQPRMQETPVAPFTTLEMRDAVMAVDG